MEKVKTDYEQERSAHDTTKRHVQHLEAQMKSMNKELEADKSSILHEEESESNKLVLKVDRDSKMEIKLDLNDRSEECERLGNEINQCQGRLRANLVECVKCIQNLINHKPS